MTIDLLSKHRKELMALAMIWIAINHSSFPFTIKAFGTLLGAYGYGGVDLLLLLSGLGIYFSCKKETSYGEYIKKRFRRIFPYLIPICIILYFLGSKSLSETFIDSFGLSMWLRKDLICWFSSFIVFIYLLSPFYYKLFKKNPYLVTIISIILVFIICLLMTNYTRIYIVIRINIYLLGFLFGYICDINPKYNCWWFLIIMIFGFVLLNYFFHSYGNSFPHAFPFFFIAPGLCILLAWIVDKLVFIQKPLKFIGDYTYQFYLIHEPLLAILYSHYEELYRPGIYFDWLINIAGILIAFGLAVIYKKIIDLIIDKITGAIAKKQEAK